MIPEEYFQNSFQPATGETNRKGIASMAIPAEFLPSDLPHLRVMHQGLYRVEVTHPSIDLDAKYNSDSELGVMVSFEVGQDFVQLKL